MFKISSLALEQSARIYSAPRSADKVTFDIGTSTAYLLRHLTSKVKAVVSSCIFLTSTLVYLGCGLSCKDGHIARCAEGSVI